MKIKINKNLTNILFQCRNGANSQKKTKRKNNRPIKIFSLNNLHDDNCFLGGLRTLKRALKSKLYFKICLLENLNTGS